MSIGLINIFGILLFSGIMLYGCYVCWASLSNNQKFLQSYKTIDLVKYFGDFGRILYIIIGLGLICTSTLMILKFLGLGPWVGEH